MMRRSSDIVRGAIAGKKIVYVVLAVLVAVGVFGLEHINKDEFPTFEIKQGLVAGIYPGATASQVEEQLAEPLEQLLFSFPEVRRESTTSVSRDGMCYVFVDVDVAPEKKSETWSRIRLKLDAQKKLLPPGVVAVAVLDEFSAVSSLLVALESEDKGWTEMKHYADDLCRSLRKIPELADVSVIGTQDEEIAVTIDPDRLAAYGISTSALMFDYQSASVPLPAGSLDTGPVNVHNPVADEYEIGEKIVWSDSKGGFVRLKDIATIERRYKEPASYVDYNGHTALIVSVEMRPDNNIVAFGEEVDRVLTEFSSGLPQSVKMSRITDQPKVVEQSVVSFLRDLLVSMAVVIIVMLMLFPMRSALIAGSGVPVCTAVTVAVMYVTGIPLNTVTLAALIVVLGMIVDDSIITMDGYMEKIGKGLPPVEAACASARELFMPMFMATFAICAMFFPTKAIITGYLGDFIRYFPWVIAIALAASLAYAMLVVPSLEVRFIGTVVAERENAVTRIQHRFFGFLQGIYDKGIEMCFRFPGLTVMGGVAAVGLGVFMFTRLNVQMMPMAARDVFAIEVMLESGNGLDDTREIADSLQRILLADSRVKSVTSFVGTGAPRFHATYPPKTPSEDFAQIIVNTVSNKATEDILAEYEGRYEHHFPKALVRFKQMDYQGVTPVSVTFSGASVEQMKPFADTLRSFMSGMSDMLKWVHGDCDEQIACIDVVMEPDEAARLGVNRAVMSLSLAGMLDGQTIATLWDGGRKVPVNVYAEKSSEEALYASLENTLIPSNLPGVYVPLRQVAGLSPSWMPAQIPHTAGEEAVTVMADMKMGHSQPAAMKKIREFVERVIVPELPEGVEVNYGGLSASNRTLVPEIGLSFACAVMILFVFMLLHFKKVTLSVLTLVLSLLCLFGAFFGLWLFDIDFSMTAVLGLISLVGIIVRNGIIMFEYAEELRFGHGYSVRDAALEAGKRRMRPIFLTSCTTALGVLPMIISGDLLWLPMGVAICFGTMLSIVLVVLIMPVSYWQMFKGDDTGTGKGGNAVKAVAVAAFLVLMPCSAGAQVRLSVDDCVEMAMQNDPQVRNACIDVLSAEAQKQEAAAEYFPKVSLNSFGFYAFDPMLEIGVKDILGESDFSSNVNNVVTQFASAYGMSPVFTALKHGCSASVTAMQPLFAGGRIVTGNRLARLAVEASGHQKEVNMRESRMRVESEYWQIVALEEKMLSLDVMSQMLDTLYKDVEAAVEAGLAADTDLMQVEMKRNELAAGKVRLRGGMRLARMNLFNSIGQGYAYIRTQADSLNPFIDDILLSDTLDFLRPPEEYYVPEEELVAELDEMRLLDISVEAERLHRRMILGEAMPQIGIGASYGYSHVLNGRFNGAVFAMVQIPISDWGKVSAKVRRQDYRVEKVQNEKEWLSMQLLLQMRQLWTEVTTEWDRLCLARQAMELARLTADRQADNYDAGLVSLSQLLQARTQQRQSVEEYIDAGISYSKALSAYNIRKKH